MQSVCVYFVQRNLVNGEIGLYFGELLVYRLSVCDGCWASTCFLCCPPLTTSTAGPLLVTFSLPKLLSDFTYSPQKWFTLRRLIFVSRSSTATYPAPPHQQLPAVDLLRSYGDLCAHSSDSSLSSVPLVQLPSASSLSLTSDPLRSQRSPGTVLAEIAQLSRETDLIRAQLSQAKGLGSGVRESLDSGNERRGLSCSSTGRVTPQSAAESRMSGSSCKERQSQHVWTPEKQQLTQQVRFKGLFEALWEQLTF